MKLIVHPHQQVWFTSDTHYMHKNICRVGSDWPAESKTRDFESLDAMNIVLVDNINAQVKEDDILFHLGDWSFGGYSNIEGFRQRINCKNIHIILGNHDHHIENDKGGIQGLFSSVHNYLKIKIICQQPEISKTLVLCHYPIASWHDMNRGVIQLHGHVHLPEHLKLHEGQAMDVGVDGNRFKPYSLTEILETMKDRPVRHLQLPNDHHED
jgi:calcineurin-like phosphoesterase family protein